MIAAAGLCSRRTAEEWLAAGRVAVDGVTAHLGDKADPDTQMVTVDGRRVGAAEKPVYVLVNKPRGCVTTLSDEKGRPTVADLVREVNGRVFPVGRLDYLSEGLLLMTNDGALAQGLLHPRFEISKTYLLTASGEVEGAAARLAAVRLLDGERIRPAKVTLLRSSGTTAVLSVTIHEGKNRQIRRMCEACGLTVGRLQRVREGPLQLGDLKPGKWRYLTSSEILALKRETGQEQP